jgi:class 3 adenylate cyclase
MNVVVAIIGIVVLVAVAYGAYRLGNSRRTTEKEAVRLEEYDFYPFVVNDDGHIEFSAELFRKAVDYFLTNRNSVAAGELVVIGEQNFVRDTSASGDLEQYKALYASYEGDSLIRENNDFLENYKRIVRLIGKSFPSTGIEILLHNLVNPSRSIVAIENGAVTGRTLEMGTTALVLDLKTRRHHNQEKLNYELNIGARRFKCTTIPIFRPEYGLVGAICINVDSRFLREEVLRDEHKLDAFFDNLLRTDFEIEENILSKEEYQAALQGKRHFLDEAIRSGRATRPEDRHLAAIMFSDIVGYTSMMHQDERATLNVVEANSRIHREALARFGGHLLKELGDGVLASFDSVSNAVACAKEIQAAVASEDGYQVRIGIHLGEVVQSGRDVLGDGVNIASRLQGEAEPGTIVVSEAVYSNVKNKNDVTATDIGERQLKNVAAPVRVYAIDA